jgi:hypothetical protein
VRRDIRRAQAVGPQEPTVFHNAACLLLRLGALDEAREQVALARRHRYRGLAKMKRDRELRVLFDASGKRARPPAGRR